LNGRELYFRSLDNRIMVTDYTSTAESFHAGTPRPWSDFQAVTTPFGADMTPASDGKHFVVFPRRDGPPAGSVPRDLFIEFLRWSARESTGKQLRRTNAGKGPWRRWLHGNRIRRHRCPRFALRAGRKFPEALKVGYV